MISPNVQILERNLKLPLAVKPKVVTPYSTCYLGTTLFSRTPTAFLFDHLSEWSEGIGAGIVSPRANLSVPMDYFPDIFQAEA